MDIIRKIVDIIEIINAFTLPVIAIWIIAIIHDSLKKRKLRRILETKEKISLDKDFMLILKYLSQEMEQDKSEVLKNLTNLSVGALLCLSYNEKGIYEFIKQAGKQPETQEMRRLIYILYKDGRIGTMMNL